MPNYTLENISTLYRARRYSHTPILTQALNRIIDHFGDRASIPSEVIIGLVKGCEAHGYPDGDHWKVFYEPCPVIKSTALEIVCISQDMSPEIQEAFPDFHKGGKFHVNKAKLQRDSRAYHSRHGEYFYLHAPESAIALPSVNRLAAA